jgi:hypothetical protein
MAFVDDSGGFAFFCEDAKMSISVSTWNTRLSQIARVIGPVLIMTGSLRDPEYISQWSEPLRLDHGVHAN